MPGPARDMGDEVAVDSQGKPGVKTKKLKANQPANGQ